MLGWMAHWLHPQLPYQRHFINQLGSLPSNCFKNTHRAKSVFPVPGGPERRTPFGSFAPSRVNLSGSVKYAMISCNSDLTSSQPFTSLNVVFILVTALIFLFPNPSPLGKFCAAPSITIEIAAIDTTMVTPNFKISLSLKTADDDVYWYDLYHDAPLLPSLTETLMGAPESSRRSRNSGTPWKTPGATPAVPSWENILLIGEIMDLTRWSCCVAISALTYSMTSRWSIAAIRAEGGRVEETGRRDSKWLIALSCSRDSFKF